MGASEDEIILAIDPGRRKCGLAVVGAGGRVLYQAVAPTEEVGAVVRELVAQWRVTRLVLGDRTTSQRLREDLRRAGVTLAPTSVDEHRSSEEGRRRYFRENPPKGWRRLLPATLQTPPRPIDDYVAIILAERYLRARPSR
jgi:RNase H-fold protein (predicted Holliday junction resolvase)